MKVMRRPLTLVLTVVLAMVLVSPAAANVRITKKPGKVSTGDTASITVVVSPKARCTIGVFYSTTKSGARGLGAKTGKKITWAWNVGSNTKPGKWPVKINCGKSGKAKTIVTVRR